MTTVAQLPRIAAMLGANLVFFLAPALAADVSGWDGDQRAAIRLIAGAPRAAIHRAGIEIRLAPGWKTYWRYPGDSGVPPRFDFSASTNVKSVTVRYPAPQQLKDESGISIGYKHDVVFPLDIVPQDAGQPVVLALKADYAICEKICIPAEGNATLTLTGMPTATSAIRPAVYVALKGPMLTPKRAVDANVLASWLALRAVEQQSKRLDAMEQARREAEQASREAAVPPPAEPGTHVPAPGNENSQPPPAMRMMTPVAPPVETDTTSRIPESERAPALPPPVTVAPAPKPRSTPRAEGTATPRAAPPRQAAPRAVGPPLNLLGAQN